MKTKNIELMKDETVIDALSSLEKDLKNSTIFLDSACRYRIQNKSFEELKSGNYLKLKFNSPNPLLHTEIAMYKVEGQKWYDVDAIFSHKVIYTKPSNPDMLIYITVGDGKKEKFQRINVEKDINPINFIISLGEKAKGKTFILTEDIVFKIIIDNHGKKTVISKKDSIEISWNNFNFCLLQKQKDSNDYILSGMCIDGFTLNKVNGDFIYLV